MLSLNLLKSGKPFMEIPNNIPCLLFRQQLGYNVEFSKTCFEEHSHDKIFFVPNSICPGCMMV